MPVMVQHHPYQGDELTPTAMALAYPLRKLRYACRNTGIARVVSDRSHYPEGLF